MEGNLAWSERIDSGNPDEYTYCNYLLDGGEGRALAIMGGSKYEAVIYGPDGKEVNRKELDQNLLERVNTLFTKKDGTLMMLTYDEDWSKCYLASYDIDSNLMGRRRKYPLYSITMCVQGSTQTCC